LRFLGMWGCFTLMLSTTILMTLILMNGPKRLRVFVTAKQRRINNGILG
jgi:hypothetical protein